MNVQCFGIKKRAKRKKREKKEKNGRESEQEKRKKNDCPFLLDTLSKEEEEEQKKIMLMVFVYILIYLAGSLVAFDTTTENYTVPVSGKCVLTCYVAEVRSFKVSFSSKILFLLCLSSLASFSFFIFLSTSTAI